MRDLFPPGVGVAIGPTEADPPLHPEEEVLALEMGAGRRAQFAAGRACARRAMCELGLPDGPVLRGVRRAPRFPDGVVGSITHTDDFFLAAVASSRAFAGLGVDAERNRAVSVRASARICAPAELAALRDLRGRTVEQWAAVVFSAKESLYKAYFPLTEVFIGFRDAEVALVPESEAAGRFEARLVRGDAPGAAGQRRFAGRYAIDAARVVTGLIIPHSADRARSAC
ncbi:MAG TPA: 4'-phosphopantetheinyl transferase superfamily protein [Myxococcota bacterium]|nr:4'-phosphopantetheinyl transferase superfamily protein [Myxococcota bacterium]